MLSVIFESAYLPIFFLPLFGNVSISVHPCVLIKTIGATKRNNIYVLAVFKSFEVLVDTKVPMLN
jgi:hypothetical protein